MQVVELRVYRGIIIIYNNIYYNIIYIIMSTVYIICFCVRYIMQLKATISSHSLSIFTLLSLSSRILRPMPHY